MIFHSTYNKPILLVGNGARTSDAIEMIHNFARKTNIPLLTTMNAVDIAQDDLHIGFIGTHGNRIANMMLNECDLLISVGARLGLRQVGRYTDTFAPKADLVRADIDEYELSRNIKKNEKKYHADARDFMRILLNEQIPDYFSWKHKCMLAKKKLDDYDKQEGNYVIEKISSLLPENPVISVDVGQHQCWCAQSLHLKGNKGRIHIGGGYGTMGCGLPYAIGSAVYLKNTPVYCIAGDGGFQMNIQELQTVKRENLPIKIFVINNKVLGKISETQHFNHNDRYANTTAESGYTVPDFQKISEAYGIKSVTLNYNDLDKYIDWINDSDPCLFNVLISENSLLTPKIKWESGKIYPDIDNSVIDMVKGILQD